MKYEEYQITTLNLRSYDYSIRAQSPERLLEFLNSDSIKTLNADGWEFIQILTLEDVFGKNYFAALLGRKELGKVLYGK